jgi:CP family cyanate transporter-like MFS transporter
VSNTARRIEDIAAAPAEDGSGPGLSLAVVAIGIMLVAIDLRPGIVSIGPVLPLIRNEFGLSHAAAALLTTIPDILMGALALPTPWLAKRIGRDRLMFGALGLLLLASFARAFVPSTALLLITTVGVGAGIAVSGTLIGGFIKACFPKKAAILIGIYASALSLGSIISAAVTGPVAVYSGGWRVGAGLWSPLGLIAIGAWYALTRQQRREGTSKTTGCAHKLPLGNRTAWMIAIFFGSQNFVFYACIAWIAPLFREHGLSPRRSGLVLASFTVAFFLSNLVFSNVSRSDDRRAPLAIGAVFVLLGLVLWAIAPDRFPFVAIPLVATGLGGAFTLGMTLPLDNTHDAAEANVWNAFVLTIGYLIGAVGPLTVGFLRDRTGSFATPVLFLVVIAIIMLLLVPFLAPAARRDGRSTSRSG